MGNCFGTTPVNNHTPGNTSKILNNPTRETKKNQPEKIGLGGKFGGGGGVLEIGSSSSSNGGEYQNDEIKVETTSIGKVITPNLKLFTLAELKKATRDFRPDTVLGEGGFGRVFKGWLDEKTYAPSKVGVGVAVAVKKSNPDSAQGLREWQAEVKFLGKFSHPNLVKLLGYCWEENQFLLVYEYMQKGSLENHLFRKGAEPLSWSTRLHIAIGAARGLAFLHNSEKSVIYRDFKTSNILLDAAYNAKLSDFGLAKAGPVNGNSHVTTRIMGTYGYAAPEYVATGHLYLKSDVFGFGVVLLELMTGFRALDTNRPSGEHVLVDWAKPSLTDRKKLKKIMDKGLGDEYPLKGAFQAAGLILECLESDPKSRPSMDEVLDKLEKINDFKVVIKEKKPNRQEQPSTSTFNYRHNKSPISHRHGANGTTSSAYRH
ncbi:probable serine/threonine-protein kinase PBL11 [Humulus lupulus]|uniref:probable serine/threonine-protein kinase PBL11 n=1 Tax=Humulus lupulus TaxID=3486 RepID=UPI002B40F07F|nr:probable serine/threonine-protein kinase PBL11 [Humulus lupulus]